LVVDPSEGPVIAGTAGASVFTLNDTGVDAGPVRPVDEVAVATTVCDPFDKGVVGTQDQFPAASAIAEQTTTPSTLTFTVAPGTAVPLIGGRLTRT